MRVLTILAVLTAVGTASFARQQTAPQVVRIEGTIPDEKLLEKAPASGVIVSAKGWDELAKEWGLKQKSESIDWTKTIFAVGTTRGGNLKVTPKVTDGDLKIGVTSIPNTKGGFRYELVSVPRDGVKTVNGQPLPKE